VRARSALVRAASAGAELLMRAGVDCVRNDLGRAIHLDRTDRQAQRLLLRRGLLDKPAIALWRELVRRLDPTVVVDVGCNYGEVVLSGVYRPGCRIWCVEANGRVAGYLSRSLWHALPTAKLAVAAAGDRPGTGFFVPDPVSSGLGRVSAVPEPGARRVATLRCDDLVAAGPADRLVFKVDVEGGEPAVLAGLAASLGTVAAAAGVIEFYLLEHAQQRRLAAQHRLYAAGLDGRIGPCLDESAVDEIFPRPGVVAPGYAKDVVLLTPAAAGIVLPAWTAGGGRGADRARARVSG
jgi:FkbM family methyltransferase